MSDHGCPLNFVHSECSEVFDKRRRTRSLGWIFRNSEGDWMYIDTTAAIVGAPLPAGTTNSRQTAINWLRMGSHA